MHAYLFSLSLIQLMMMTIAISVFARFIAVSTGKDKKCENKITLIAIGLVNAASSSLMENDSVKSLIRGLSEDESEC